MSFSPIMVASIPPTGFPPLRDLNTLRPRPWSRQQLLLPLLGGPRPGSTTRSAGLRLRETELVRVTVFKLGVPWRPGDGDIPRDLPSENWTAFRGFGLPRFSASRRVGPGPLSAQSALRRARIGRPAGAPQPEGACLTSWTASGPAHLQVVLGKVLALPRYLHISVQIQRRHFRKNKPRQHQRPRSEPELPLRHVRPVSGVCVVTSKPDPRLFRAQTRPASPSAELQAPGL